MIKKLLRCLVFVHFSECSLSVEFCEGGNVCPTGNTCCAGGCIASDLGKLNATCCDDGKTGCGVGYACQGGESCTVKIVTDPLVEKLPRYYLCNPTKATLENIHGFPIDKEYNNDKISLAYYFSHNEDIMRLDLSTIDFVFIVIHGANRNADDYFCAASSSVGLQNNFQNVLIIAPRFLSTSDGPIHLRGGGLALRWKDDADGTWRYGAKSIFPEEISSFFAFDLMMQFLVNRTQVPITIFGHSSGGQFVQRWSLLTDIKWPRNRLKAIVANPSSYAYLTPLRKIEGEWRIPKKKKCPNYNVWEWGLDDKNGSNVDDDYKRHALGLLNSDTKLLIERFGARSVFYLIGGQDRCNVSSSSSSWCNSHGLETSCMDEYQGSMRYERFMNYWESLLISGINMHGRHVVYGVGHDHSLMMSRPEVLRIIFSPHEKLKEEVI